MYQLNGLAQTVFLDRYALKDDNGKRIEDTPEQMWQRVAKAIAAQEPTEAAQRDWQKKFYNILNNFDFVPGGRILSGAGSGVPLTLYNCFVIPSPEDSRGGILESVKLMVEIMSRGGGVGVNLSTIRPRGTYVKGVNGTASGAVSFGALFSFATGLIIQGGSRRGALMLMLDVDHPDVEEFIKVKRTMGQVTNANLSVCISDSFMNAVKEDKTWDLQWQGRVYRTIQAKELWNLICESAWTAGEPGLMFKDRYNKESNSWYFEEIIATNPCGEQGLPAWGVCNLGSVNVANFVSADGAFDYERLGQVVGVALRFLDNVVDTTEYFFPENEAAQRRIRRTGLGTMGLADALIKMKLRYGSPESLTVVEKIHQVIRDEAYRASTAIAAEKGSFPAFDAEKYLQGRFVKRLPQEIRELIERHGIRNGVLLTQAPTGTTSILAGVSSGIEPVYDFAFQRSDRLGVHTVYHPLYEAWKEAHPTVTEAPDFFVNAKQLTPEEHVTMQALIQSYVDSSISKTVNAPNNHTAAEVQELYMKAYDMGCKGITYYRDGSRSEAVLTSLDEQKEKMEQTVAVAAGAVTPSATDAISPRLRPEKVAGVTYKIKTGYGTMFVTVNHDEDGAPFEVFATIGKAGGVFAEESEAICRLVSLALRARIPLATVIEQIKGIRGPMPIFGKAGMILSIPDAIAQVLTQHQQDLEAKQTPEQRAAEREKEVVLMQAETEQMVDDTMSATVKKAESKYQLINANGSVANIGLSPECPECHGLMAMAEGCLTCFSCGYSKCS